MPTALIGPPGSGRSTVGVLPAEIDGVDWLRRWLEDGLDERLSTELVITGDETAVQTAGRLAGRRGGADRPWARKEPT